MGLTMATHLPPELWAQIILFTEMKLEMYANFSTVSRSWRIAAMDAFKVKFKVCHPNCKSFQKVYSSCFQILIFNSLLICRQHLGQQLVPFYIRSLISLVLRNSRFQTTFLFDGSLNCPTFKF